jgi:TrmH family RNA methyltransferase
LDLSFEQGEPPIKWLRKVAKTKHPLNEQYCIVEGWKAISEASEKRTPHLVLHTEAVATTLNHQDWHKEEPTFIISPKDIKEFCSTQTPEGVLAIFDRPQTNAHFPEGKPGELHLGLYEWRDPSNVGAVVRTARGLGVSSVTMIGHGPKFFSTKVIRCSMGSVFHLPLHQITSDDTCFSNSSAEQNNAPNFVCATATSQSSKDWKPKKDWSFLMIGSESHGFPEHFSSQFNNVGIPLKAGLESLSAPIASALIMDHLLQAHSSP